MPSEDGWEVRAPGARTALTDQFKQAQHHINLNSRERVAIAAHLEVRGVLMTSPALAAHGLKHTLIGSYPRKVTIWPGKDVDIFGKLTTETIDSIAPAMAYNLFLKALTTAFDGRISEQPRSIKIDYRGRTPDAPFLREAAAVLRQNPDTPADSFEFSVDVVPAVRWGDVWAIPSHDKQRWERTAAADRWVRTDPERLTELTQTLNGDIEIAGQGSYVPTVKAIRQIRRWHLRDAKPGGLYIELVLHEGFSAGEITGENWAGITASALGYVAHRLTTVAASPLCEPALNQPYVPAPDPQAISHAAAVFAGLAADARRAVDLDPCPAAAIWRRIFGDNAHAGGPVFPLPTGCREDGMLMPATVVVNPLSGTNESRGFGAA